MPNWEGSESQYDKFYIGLAEKARNRCEELSCKTEFGDYVSLCYFLMYFVM